MCKKYNVIFRNINDEVKTLPSNYYLKENKEFVFSIQDIINDDITKKYNDIHKFSLNSSVGFFFLESQNKNDLTQYLGDFEKFDYYSSKDNLILKMYDKKVIYEYTERVDVLGADYHMRNIILMRFHNTNNIFFLTNDGDFYWLNSDLIQIIDADPNIIAMDFYLKNDISIAKVKKLCSHLIRYYDKIFLIPYLSKEERTEINAIKENIYDNTINLKVLDFFNQVAQLNCIYVSLDYSKNGCLAKFFINKYNLEYIVVPNIIKEDDTINVLIKEPSSKDAHICYEYMVERFERFPKYNVYNISLLDCFQSLNIEDKSMLIQYNYIYIKRSKDTEYNLATWTSLNEAIKKGLNYDNDDQLAIFYLNILKVICKRPRYKYSCYLERFPIYPRRASELVQQSWDCGNGSISWIAKENISLKQYVFFNRIEKEYHNIIKSYFNKLASVKQVYDNFESLSLSEMIANGFYDNKWKSEKTLYCMIKEIYDDAIYQYHSSFLEKQSLDIFIPSLSLGIEYQGQQHYQPIDFFGGEIGFQKVIERDKRKAEICKKNNIILIYWKYNEIITKKNLIKKLKKFNFDLPISNSILNINEEKKPIKRHKSLPSKKKNKDIKAIKEYDLFDINGNFIKKFSKVKDAALFVGCDPRKMSDVLNKRRKSYKGYILKQVK